MSGQEIVECGTVSATAQLVEGTKVRNEDLVELAREIQKADVSIKASANGKLQNILNQMRHLQEQARTILEDTKRDADLHHAACNFKKVPGNVYFLYKRKTGQTYFSMLSPDEWTNCPHEFLGGFKLEFDMTWIPSDEIKSRDEDSAIIETLISKQFKPSLTYD